jgi:hypothetical protein
LGSYRGCPRGNIIAHSPAEPSWPWRMPACGLERKVARRCLRSATWLRHTQSVCSSMLCSALVAVAHQKSGSRVAPHCACVSLAGMHGVHAASRQRAVRTCTTHHRIDQCRDMGMCAANRMSTLSRTCGQAEQHCMCSPCKCASCAHLRGALCVRRRRRRHPLLVAASLPSSRGSVVSLRKVHLAAMPLLLCCSYLIA